MTPRVQVAPALYQWAVARNRLGVEAYTKRFPKLPEWIAGAAAPTLKQLEELARATHTPVGYFFLPEPPVEEVPIPDMRTVASRDPGPPSPDLLETLFLCQQRQDWYRAHLLAQGAPALGFVGSVEPGDSVVKTAASMREALGFSLEERAGLPTWTEALRRFVEQVEALGVLVMGNGVVGTNTRRKLDPQEFRGFALSDERAPLVFLNGADSRSARMFTLAHELAHIWLGRSALSDVGPATRPSRRIERWCDRVAAELLVPAAAMRRVFDPDKDLDREVPRLARRFKVSTLVILRRVLDIGGLDQEEFRAAYQAELRRLEAHAGRQARGGGDFYRTQVARVGKPFARAVIASTYEGLTLFRDAFRLLGVNKTRSLERLGRDLGVA